MRKALNILLIVVMLGSLGIAWVQSVQAQEIELKTGTAQVQKELGNFAGQTIGNNTADLKTMIANIVKFILALLGMVMMIIVIYAGVLWMTSGGNSEKVDKAKKLLVSAIVGLALIFAAYAIADFAVTNIANITGTGK